MLTFYNNNHPDGTSTRLCFKFSMILIVTLMARNGAGVCEVLPSFIWMVCMMKAECKVHSILDIILIQKDNITSKYTTVTAGSTTEVTDQRNSKRKSKSFTGPERGWGLERNLRVL